MNVNKIFWVFILCILIISGGFVWKKAQTKALTEKIYVAVEGNSAIAVINPRTQTVVKRIDLTKTHDGGTLAFAPHNVQVAPDGKTVWVTGNAGKHADHSRLPVKSAFAHTNDPGKSGEPDEVIIINPLIDTVVKRIPIAPASHLAHVVLTPDNARAIVSAQTSDKVYIINAQAFSIEKTISLPPKSQPHGLRITPDGKTAYIAQVGRPSLLVLDISTGQTTEISVGDAQVQTGITPDGSFVVASLYATRRLAILDLRSKRVSYVALPPSSRGPIQMYATADSRYMYLADQGYYFGQPTSEYVYKIDLAKRAVVAEVKAGLAPHGVVTSDDGKFVYVTNLLSGDVSVIDTATDQEIARIPVGTEPNGISYWKNPHSDKSTL